MSIAAVNAALELAALLNQGADHNCAFELHRLPTAPSLAEALDGHFGSMVDWRTQKPRSPSEWHIRVTPLSGSAAQALTKFLNRWVFETPMSPHFTKNERLAKHNVINHLCELILAVVGDAEVHAVTTSPPIGIWYEAAWDDLALSNGSLHWLLHLGVTD